MDNQQGPTVEHREVCSMLCCSQDGSRVWGRMHTCICTTESLCCPPETHIIVNWLYFNIKYKVKKKSIKIFLKHQEPGSSYYR